MPPTVQATDDFDHAIDSSYYTDAFFGSPVAVTTPQYQAQPKSLEVTTTVDPEGMGEDLTGPPAIGWMGFAFRTSLIDSSLIHVANFWASGFSETAALWMSSSGLYADVGGGSSSPVAISVDTWHWVELIYDCSTGTHSLNLRVDDGTAVAGTSTAAATTVFRAQLNGQYTTARTLHYGIWKYGSTTSASDWLGEPSAEMGNYLIQPARIF